MCLSSDPEKTIRVAFEKLRERNRVLKGDPVVVVSDVAAGHEHITSIQVRVFDDWGRKENRDGEGSAS